MALLPVEDAQARLLVSAIPITADEEVSLRHADGRVLAQDLAAKLTQPPFDASAMDGYAVRGADIATIGAELHVIGTAAAGHAFTGSVEPGQTVRIFTGAPMPLGADTVLMQEDAQTLGSNRIRTTFTVPTGRHVRPRGQDFTEGETVLTAGTRMDFARLTVAAAMNQPVLCVLAKPLVAILATGDELVAPGNVPGPSQILASNTFGIAALAQAAGAEILDLGIVADNADDIAKAVQRAQDAGADVLVTLGGASVGDHDLVQSTLIGCGMVLDFWKIAMRPGKPLMVGSLGAMHVLGLPGNPVSSLVCGLLFLEPLIRKLAGLPPIDRITTAVTATDLAANDHRQDYLRATLVRSDDGLLRATSFGKQDSSMMKVFSRADALIVRAPNAPAVPAGDACDVMVLRDV